MLDAEVVTQSADKIDWGLFRPGVTPVGHRVLVYVLPTERKTSGGILVPDSVAEQQDLRQIKARVMAIGTTAWADTADGEPWALSGDMVYIAKFAGHLLQGEDGKRYRLINDLDITALCDPLKDEIKEEDSADFVTKMVEQLEETENA